MSFIPVPGLLVATRRSLLAQVTWMLALGAESLRATPPAARSQTSIVVSAGSSAQSSLSHAATSRWPSGAKEWFVSQRLRGHEGPGGAAAREGVAQPVA